MSLLKSLVWIGVFPFLNTVLGQSFQQKYGFSLSLKSDSLEKMWERVERGVRGLNLSYCEKVQRDDFRAEVLRSLKSTESSFDPTEYTIETKTIPLCFPSVASPQTPAKTNSDDVVGVDTRNVEFVVTLTPKPRKVIRSFSAPAAGNGFAAFGYASVESIPAQSFVFHSGPVAISVSTEGSSRLRATCK